MSDLSLFAPVPLGKLTLSNRLVMAPMTRSRAVDNIPNAMMQEYYVQRASAGLIISEGTAPSPNGLGYSSIPGIYSVAQVAGWRPITAAVHQAEGHIFVQIMHTGRVGHLLNMPKGAEVVAPSALVNPGEMHTSQGMKPFVVPRAMTDKDLLQARDEFTQAAKNAVAAGFDGIELHAANGYLLEQFLSPITNQRTDAYGGSVVNRLRFVLEVAQAACSAIGADRVGIRVSPHGLNGGMQPYPEADTTYLALAKALDAMGLVYFHVVDHTQQGTPLVSQKLWQELRQAWSRTFIASGGFNRAKAEAALREGRADLIAMARPFISNPDLVQRLQNNQPLNPMDPKTLFSPGSKGYTDYQTVG